MTSATITLSQDSLDTIDSFIDEMLDAGKSSKMDDFRDAYARGKGAEQALATHLNEEYAIDAEVDYDVYDGSDSTDLLPYSVEVKTIPHYGNHVAIPVNKARQIDEDEPIFIVKHHSTEKFTIAGWCKKTDLSLVEQGEKPWTQQADNLCMPVEHLSDDLRQGCEEMGADPQSKFSFSNS